MESSPLEMVLQIGNWGEINLLIGIITPFINVLVMAEILHQFIGSLSHYF